MLHQKRKKVPGHSTTARVKKEMAKPRMSKSARMVQESLKKGVHLGVTVKLKTYIVTINEDSEQHGASHLP